MKTMLFNPYTGTPRHPADISSDPEGILIMDPEATTLEAYKAPASEPERKPMSYEQLAEIGDRVQPHEWSSAFARAIEAHHGIVPPEDK